MRARFVRGEDPRKMMEIGETALEKDRIRSLDWGMTDDFLEDVLTRDYGFEEYMGFKILIYPVANTMWFATTSRPETGFKIGSSSGIRSESKESALKDLKAKIRKRLRNEG